MTVFAYTDEMRKFNCREFGGRWEGTGNFLLIENAKYSQTRVKVWRYFETDAERKEFIAANPAIDCFEFGPFKERTESKHEQHF